MPRIARLFDPLRFTRGIPREPSMIRSTRKTVPALALAAALAACVAGGAFAPNAMAQGDPAKGREKIQACAGCHGIEGYRTAYPEVYAVPRIAGQHEAYLAKALQAYKSGERNHPSMRAIASSLSDEDMANLAAYYARAPRTRTAAK
jgi:cytochrome c553